MDVDEFMGALDDFRLKVDKSMAMAAFNALDTDRSGTISRNDLERALKDRIAFKTREAAKQKADDN